MHGDALLIILLLVFGCAAFFFGVIYCICQLFAWVSRGVWGVLRHRCSSGPAAWPAAGSRRRVCSNERCRKLEYRKARYCSQCGTPFAPAPTRDES
jgi:hypothetical protein